MSSQHSSFRSLTATVALAGVLAAPLRAQVTPRALLIVQEPLAGSPGRKVNTIERIAPNHAGGVLASVSTNDLVTSNDPRDVIWGSVGDTSFTRLVRADPSGPLALSAIDEIPAENAGVLAYIARSGPDALVVRDGAVVAREGEPTAPGGATWTSDLVGLKVDAAGDPWFRGRYLGASSGVGLFRGLAPVFVAGDTLMGMPGTVDQGGAPFPGYDVTEDGAHWLAVVRSTAGFRQHVVRTGELLSAGGVPLSQGATLPPAFQISPGETYNTFLQAEIASFARWAVWGATPSAFIVRDGNMYRRRGDVVDGRALGEGIRGIALDAAGSIAWIGRIDNVGSSDTWAVFREDTFLFEEGDGVDVDGDGAADAGYSVFSILGDRGRLVLGEDGAVYSLVQLSTPAGVRFALVVAELTLPVPYCSSNPHAGGDRARLQTRGSTAVLDDDLSLACIDMPQNTFALFLASRDAGFTANPGGSLGDLCLGGTIGRFNDLIRFSG
ncbi:MAG: hypothetical protein AAFP86_14300, partial [Planctomycetota bacterium]